jgi:hypothetical protein
MDSILTTTESFIFVLDSRNATTYINGSFNSSLVFNIEDAIKIDAIKMTCCVSSFTMANSIYNINEFNSNLSITANLFTTNYVIPYGNYNATTFMTQLISQLGSDFSISLNPINNIFTLKALYNFTINNSSIYQVMGLNQVSISSINQVIVMPFQCNFNGVQNININMDNIKTENIDSYSKSFSSIIQSISVDNTSQQIFFEKQNDFVFEIKQDVIDHIQISIRDDLENLLNLNNAHWNMTLQFTELVNIDRFKHENNFDNIIRNGYE